MKILHLLCFPLFGSGSGTYVRKLAEITKRQYPKDEIAILCPDEKRKIKSVKIIPLELPFPVSFTGHPDWPDSKIYSKLSEKQMVEVIENIRKQTLDAIELFKPDIIHSHHASIFTAVASEIRAIYNINYIVTIHGTGVLCASEDKRWLPIVKPGLNDAYRINAVSGDTKKWMLKIFGQQLNRKTRIITGGVDVEAFPKEGSTDIVDKLYDLKDKKVVIFSGKLTPKKGVEYLIKAASKINAQIFIIGGGDDKERLETIAEKVKAKNIIFTGYKGKDSIEEFRQFYRKADVFVFPSIWDEPLGLVALEAMASGTPVVASNKGGIPLAVKNNQNGFLVRARSSKAIAEKVNKILKDEKLQERLADNARTTVEEKFDWKIIAARFYKYYKEAEEQSTKQKKHRAYLEDKKQRQREHIEIKGKKLDYI